MKRVLLLIGNTVLPILFVFFAVTYTRKLISDRETPAAHAGPREAALVSAVTPERVAHDPVIEAFGVVVPARELVIQTEVAGRIEAIHPNLVAGGLVREGEELVRVDARDYRLAVREAQSALEQAETQLALERGRQELAAAEWESYAAVAGAGDSELATREPQLRAAELAVEAAQVRLDRARLNLSRTTVRAPMDALVLTESAEPGLLATAQTQLARLVGTDAFWVELSVPFDQLEEITLGDGETPGAIVEVLPSAAPDTTPRRGHVLRLLGQLDADARMARVLVEVPDPLGLGAATSGRPTPMLLGAYVTARIDAGEPIDALRVPSETLRAGGTLWVMTANNTLDVRSYEVLARDESASTAIVSADVRDGERVVRSHLSSPVTGMSLRLQDATAPAAESEAAEGSR